MAIKTFRDLIVWQKAHTTALAIYEITKLFPSEEKFGLVSQLRRAASSVPTNIVEGYKKKSRKELLHYLNTADSSLEETKYHLLLAKDLGYIKEPDYARISAFCDEIGKMLFGLQRRLPIFA